MVTFDHPNVMALIGVVLGPYEEVPHLIIPFMKNGNLLNHLKTSGSGIPINKLLEFCLEVAQGLEYLASRKIVHGDLACRNYLLNDNYHIVIADYGLTKVTDVNGYYLSKEMRFIPFRYVAPESLAIGMFTTESDIWSYGISVWEILSRGNEPYVYPEGIGSSNGTSSRQDMEDLQNLLASGRRLLKPELCSPLIYELMLYCWDFDRKRRPTPDLITARLRQAIHEYQEPINSKPVLNSRRYVVAPQCV